MKRNKNLDTRFMKKQILNRQSLFFLIVIAGLFSLFTGCNLSNDSSDGSLPVIDGVRYMHPDSAETAQLEQLGPGETLAIKGQNLKSAGKVFFNGLEASFNPVFVTNQHMIITVPDMPFGTLDPLAEEMNTIKIESPYGEVVFDFPIVPPMPNIEYVNKEFANAGETITLTGNYLYMVTEVTFPGGITTDEFESSPDGDRLTVTVPQGITEEGFVNVTTTAGTTSDLHLNMFNNSTGVIANFDDKNPFTPWGETPVVTDSYPGIEPVSGNYIHWHLTDIPVPYWWSQELATPMDAQTDWPDIDPEKPLSDLVLRFEMNIPEGLNSGLIRINFNFEYEYDWNPFVVDEERVTLQTDGWETFEIPLEVLYDIEHSDGLDESANFYSDINHHLHLFYVNPDDGEPVDVLNIAYDNFRIIEIN